MANLPSEPLLGCTLSGTSSAAEAGPRNAPLLRNVTKAYEQMKRAEHELRLGHAYGEYHTV